MVVMLLWTFCPFWALYQLQNFTQEQPTCVHSMIKFHVSFVFVVLLIPPLLVLETGVFIPLHHYVYFLPCSLHLCYDTSGIICISIKSLFWYLIISFIFMTLMLYSEVIQ